jgi:hypothetical protein
MTRTLDDISYTHCLELLRCGELGRIARAVRVDREAAAFDLLFDPSPWVVDERDRWLVIEPFSVTGRRLQVHDVEQAPTTLFFR